MSAKLTVGGPKMRVRRQGGRMAGQLRSSALAAGGCSAPARKALILNPVNR